MLRLIVGIAAGLSAAPAMATQTILADFEGREQVDTFASSARYAMVEPISSPRSHGRGAVQLRFFGHPSLEGPPQVLASYRYGGLRYGNWAPYEHLKVDVLNPGDTALALELVVEWQAGDEKAELAVPIEVPPSEWITVTEPVSELADEGADVAAIVAFGFRAPLGDAPRPSKIIVDYVRLTGTDEQAIGEACRAEDATADQRQPRGIIRTSAADLAATIEPTGQKVKRSVKAPVVATPQVLVVGGGLAGVAAAVTASRMGCDTLLVERAGSLGGMGTTGLVPPAFRATLSGGIVEEYCRRLDEAGGPTENRNPEIMKYVLLDMMQESKARLMLYTLAVDAIVREKTIEGVVVENKSGTQALLAHVVIDCTGDADVAAWAGAPFEIGRGRDEETQTQTLVFLLGNVNTGKLMPVRKQLPDFVREARKNGDFKSRFAGGAAIQPVVLGEHGVVNVNSINVPQVSGLKVEDLTYSHIEAHREAVLLVDFYRKYVPGCEECYLLDTAEFIGVRESRRIVGEYTLTGEEALAGAEFPDAIARGFYPIDIHSPDGTGDAAGARLGQPYDIPYGCLVPKEIDNLLVAGRPISADHVAHGSLRVMGTTMPLGEAAGCAAALCVAKERTPRELDGRRVRRMLRRLGAQPRTHDRAPDNLALSKHGVVVTVDSDLPSHAGAPAFAIDGIIGRGQESRWLSDDTPPPHWIELRFPEETEFDRLKLHFYTHAGNPYNKQYVPAGFEVQVERGDGWVKVAGVSDNTDLVREVVFDPATAATMRVLFTVSCPSDDIVRLREIEVHNGPPRGRLRK